MREDDDQGRPRVYWVTHGTSLVRCSGEQIRPLVEEIGQNLEKNLDGARQALQNIRRRGVVQYTDLTLLPAPDLEEFDPPVHNDMDVEVAPEPEPAIIPVIPAPAPDSASASASAARGRCGAKLRGRRVGHPRARRRAESHSESARRL